MTDTAGAVRVEYAKLRRRRLPAIGIGVVSIGLLFSSAGLFTSGGRASFDDPTATPWLQLMLTFALTCALVFPLLVAILGSRAVEIEHEGNGWILARMVGRGRGALCRIKLLALTPILFALILAQFTLQVVIARAAGLDQPIDFGLWTRFGACVFAVSTALLALHICFSAWVDNQVVGLGLGVVGSFLGLFSLFLPPSFAAVLPWGYYAISTPVSMSERGGPLATSTPNVVALLMFCVVSAAAFIAATVMLDRKDV